MLKLATDLIGRKIVQVSEQDFGGFKITLFHLDDGTALYGLQDDEGNGPASMFLNTGNKDAYLVMAMPTKTKRTS
jgi:hypothetical protein